MITYLKGFGTALYHRRFFRCKILGAASIAGLRKDKILNLIDRKMMGKSDTLSRRRLKFGFPSHHYAFPGSEMVLVPRGSCGLVRQLQSSKIENVELSDLVNPVLAVVIGPGVVADITSNCFL